FFPIMAAYAFYFNKRMKIALRKSKDRIGDINAQVEDTLSGIRVVKSFKSEGYFSAGLIAFTQLMAIAAIIFGGARIAVGASLDLADLVTFLLCIGIL